MIRRPPRSTQGVSSAASDVYKRQVSTQSTWGIMFKGIWLMLLGFAAGLFTDRFQEAEDQEQYTTHYFDNFADHFEKPFTCLLYTSPSPRDLSTSRMPSSA
eukprot:TRINITY_DN7683_c0_g2_i1.p2 TRINITY_DN7683_c0_g2~~TRINITY_DN7683_c0_g2_i1.p2  ORF type:complete len:101 (-),score=34.40 TRINITY_DN7683_c0_g2_i1:69-371(-)